MALGATPGHVQRSVIIRTLRLAAIGMTLGLVSSWALARTMRSLLFGVTFSDPATFAVALVALVAVAALAGYLPARRAARLQPVDALRAESVDMAGISPHAQCSAPLPLCRKGCRRILGYEQGKTWPTPRSIFFAAVSIC
jgi:predicted lysophospholipase L1 biosynthesis ABC-type transport system permease subunit